MRKEIPILFSTVMVQAIIAGNKTMTRRIVSNVPDNIKGNITWGYSCFTPKGFISLRTKFKTNKGHRYGEKFFKLKCSIGDILWVRETWAWWQSGATNHQLITMYKASENVEWMKWKPSIFMAKTDARIWLEVKNVKVERLHDITEEDAKAEGLDTVMCSPKLTFITLWDHINGDGAWDENPFVWVISFKVLSTTGKL